MSRATHRERLHGYEEFVDHVMQTWQIPGVAIGIVKDDEVIYARGFGQRDREQGLETTPQSIFAIGSCTKAFVAMSLAMLVDEGKLAWDAPLRNYLPEFKLADSVTSERLTTRDILTHRSGLPGHDALAYNSLVTVKELIGRLPHLEFNKDLRAGWQYNNLLYGVAGYLLEAISGQSWDAFIRQRILEPLGMNSTSFSVQDVQRAADYALPYKTIKGKTQRTRFYPRFNKGTSYDPAGALNSNVEDMTKWLRALLKQSRYGEQRLVSEAQFKQILEPQGIIPIDHYQVGMKYPEEARYCAALGWRVFSYRGHELAQHSGGIDGFTVMTTFLPDDNLGIVVLTNLEFEAVLFPNIFAFNICDRLLGLDELPWNERMLRGSAQALELKKQAQQALTEGQVPGTALSHPLSAYAGQYEHPGYGLLTLTVEGEGLKAFYNDLEYSLTHFHYDAFLAYQSHFDLTLKVSFGTNLAGNIASLAVPLEPEVNPIVFTRLS
ncbi:serine hydrolase [Ktedonosporobacter rubrisoli]|uniref:Serine hydrolase n=1 Tax=Ktedonosporobacter rubrisoli TaxID=2509675 RepID=A0A4P6JP11_KTERU|nr:serine hydrolase [Ktedonosporobacter rubrisoli]QBD76985.1 serine hydrolase [Ktedonosporobacter rubrisoli]